MLKHNLNLDAVTRIREPDFKREQYLRLDKNERTFDFSNKFLDCIKKRVGSYLLTAYPEIDTLYSAIAEYNQVPPEQVFVSAGSEYSVKSVIEAFLNPGDTILLHKPSYALYSIYPKFYGSIIREVHYGPDLRLDLSKFIAAIDQNVALVVLENPNGFVGNAYTLQEIAQVAEACLRNECALVVDEAYYYLNDTTALDLLGQYPNILVMRTFSKAFGLAGIRVGYIIAGEELIQLVRKTTPMHEVNGFAAMVVDEILKQDHLMLEAVTAVKSAKKMLIDELTFLGMETVDTKTNFILTRLPEHITKKRLLDEMILVRRPFEESYLKGYTRITVGDERQAVELITTIKRLL